MLHLSLMALLALLALAIGAEAGSPPPIGDWTVTDSTTIDGGETFIEGNITVDRGGHLTLANMTLVMVGYDDGSVGIYVESTGQLTLYNATILSWSQDVHYWFVIRGRASIIDSDISDVASNDAEWNDWYSIRGGVQVFGPNVVVVNSKFHDCQRINMYVNGVSPTIENCEFFNAEYVSTYQTVTYSYPLEAYMKVWYADATGLLLYHAKPTITSSRFYSNGITSSALPFYDTGYAHNCVVTLGRGVLAYESSPRISECELSENGEQPYDRRIGGTNQTFDDTPLGDDDPIEGGLVCLGGNARPEVSDSTFDSNDLFGICGLHDGFPTLVEGCDISRNQYLRGSSVYSPSAGLFIFGGLGNVTVANTTASENIALANIWIDGPSLHLVNYSNSNNIVSGAYNVHLGRGSHSIEGSFLRGEPSLAANVVLGPTSSASRLRVDASVLQGGNVGLAITNSQGAIVRIENSTMRGISNWMFFLTRSTVQCVNCTFDAISMSGLEVGGQSTVDIFHLLTVHAAWQNAAPVPGAQVFALGYDDTILATGTTNDTGDMAPLAVRTVSYTVSGSSVQERDFTPVDVVVTYRGVEGSQGPMGFDKPLHVDVTLTDPEPPRIIVIEPINGSTIGARRVTFRGLAIDNVSGMLAIEVSRDGEDWGLIGVDEWDYEHVFYDGPHRLWVRAHDVAGNAAIVTVDILVDTVPPFIEILEPSPLPHYTREDSVTIWGKTEREATVMLNQTMEIPNVDGSFKVTIPGLPEGRSYFVITVTDRVGFEQEAIVEVVRDVTPPLIVFTKPPELTRTPELLLMGYVSDINLANVTIDGVPVVEVNNLYWITLEEGPNEIVVWAIDLAGNVATRTFNVTLDTIPPVIEMIYPTGDLLINHTQLVVRGSVESGIDVVKVDGMDVPVIDGAFEMGVNLIEGMNTVTVGAVDEAGNRWSIAFNVVVDLVPPTLTLTSPLDWSYTNWQFVEVVGSAPDAVRVIVDGIERTGLLDPFQVAVDLEETPPGGEPNLIQVVAMDAAGNRAQGSLHVYRDTIEPGFTLDPTPVTTKKGYVTIGGRLSDLDEVVTVRVDDGEVPVAGNGTFQITLPLELGLNYFTVSVSDAAGNEATRSVTVDRQRRDVEEGGGLPIWLLLVVCVVIVAVFYLLYRRQQAAGGEE